VEGPRTARRNLVSTSSSHFQCGTERIRTDHAGGGLGLVIAKSITQAHDGTLTLTPRSAGGLRVTVHYLPQHTRRALDPRASADHRFNDRLYFDSIADHGGRILMDRELRGWSPGFADTA
jgi:Histidine kinase-, DNA gyrase B-, and HSP90-like ATPase